MRQLVITNIFFTQRDFASLDKYFNEIDKIGLATVEEEVSLSERIRRGDELALERLVKTNLRFVISVAKQYQNQGLSLGDLINEGNIGLITAAKRFDGTRGFKFISFAVWWIRQAIIFAIAEHVRIVRLPYNQLTMLNKLNKASSTFEQIHGQKPTTEDLADCLGITKEKVSDLLCRSRNDLSIDEFFRLDEEHNLIDVLQTTEFSPDYYVIKDEIRKEVYSSLKVLCQRDRDVVCLFFGLGNFSPMPIEDIGKKFNLSAEHARRLKDKALEKLRNSSKGPVLLSCLA